MTCRASGCRTALHGLLVAELRRVVRATDRRPLGPIIRVGPLHTDDVADLVAWLRAGHYDRHELPRHLLATHRMMGAAASN